MKNGDNNAIALFGNTNNATIENLGLEGGTIKSSAWKIAAEAGDESVKELVDSGIECNYIAGIANWGNGSDYITQKGPILKRCYTKDINFGTAIEAYGVAKRATSMEECYNASNISGFYIYAVGTADEKIINCYNTGNVTEVNIDGEEGYACGIRNKQ